MSDPINSGWETLQKAASSMRVWQYNSELEWAKEAWGHLHAAGLTGGETILKQTAAKIRLVTLARIYGEFYGLAREDPLELSLSDLAGELDIDPIALGLLVPPGNRDEFDYADDKYDLREQALDLITDGQRTKIFKCLRAAYKGPLPLYTRMWHAILAMGTANQRMKIATGMSLNSISRIARPYLT